jgi:hypothetical protein
LKSRQIGHASLLVTRKERQTLRVLTRFTRECAGLTEVDGMPGGWHAGWVGNMLIADPTAQHAQGTTCQNRVCAVSCRSKLAGRLRCVCDAAAGVRQQHACIAPDPTTASEYKQGWFTSTAMFKGRRAGAQGQGQQRKGHAYLSHGLYRCRRGRMAAVKHSDSLPQLQAGKCRQQLQHLRARPKTRDSVKRGG